MAFPSVVVITGASAGVGRASARKFASRGADVGLLARDSDGLRAAAKEIEALGRRAVAVPTDVADPEQVEAAAARVEEQLGPIDVWVNNAMTSVFALFTEIEPEEFRRVTEVTYLGFVHGTRTALRRMLPRDRGTIVQVGSALAYRGIPLQSAYCGGKHAIQGFTESVRTELLHDKSAVRLTMVQMPALNTPQFEQVLSKLPNRPQPVPPIYQPEVAASAIVWAATRRRLLGWASRGRALLIEDDYDAEFRYDRQPVRALQGLDPQRVAYLGTTSKSLAPALRLGWLIVPGELADQAGRIKHLLDVCSPPIDQLALARFISRGEYDRHVRRARAVYRRRRDRLLAELNAKLPGLAVHGVAAGMHVLLGLPPGVDDRLVAAEAARDGVRVVPLSTYQLTPSDEGGLVIGYGRIHQDALDPAVTALARALQRAQTVTARPPAAPRP